MSEEREGPSFVRAEDLFRRAAPKFFVPTLCVHVLGQKSGKSVRRRSPFSDHRSPRRERERAVLSSDASRPRSWFARAKTRPPFSDKEQSTLGCHSELDSESRFSKERVPGRSPG